MNHSKDFAEIPAFACPPEVMLDDEVKPFKIVMHDQRVPHAISWQSQVTQKTAAHRLVICEFACLGAICPMLIGRKLDRWSLIDSELSKQFVLFLPMVGDPLKHFPLDRLVQPVMLFTALNHKTELGNFTGFLNEQFQLRQQNLRSVQ
jgi:hypothetical protein